MKILPIRSKGLPPSRSGQDISYVYVAVDCEHSDIEELIGYCRLVCTGDWHHTFNMANPIWQDRTGAVHFRSMQDAALFKLRYSDLFEAF